jgi:pimeloyl-ACP methyl ester carboxylesterase
MRGALLAAGVAGAIAAKVAADAAIRRHERLTASECPRRGRVVEVDGVEVHYEEAGAGPALLFLHGLGASGFAFRKNVPELAGRFRVIAPDLPGFGFSGRDAPDLSMTALAGYAAGLLDALGVDRVSVVGHSMGGDIALRLALAEPARVERLVLVAPATDGVMRRGALLAPLYGPLLPVWAAALRVLPGARRWWLSHACYDSSYLTEDVLAGYAAPGMVRGHVAALRRLLRDRGKDGPYDPSVIKAPVLIVWGEADRILGAASGRRLAGRVPGAEFLVVEGAGHWLPEEQPQRFNEILLSFLTSDDRRSTARAYRREAPREPVARR